MLASPRRLGLIAAAALIPVAAAGGYAVAASTAGAPVRDDLAATDHAVGAPGRTLGLVRIVIPAHAKLAPHTHPGTEVARIVKGTLTYTVQRHGSVRWMRGEAGSAKLVRRLRPGQTGRLRAGDWIVEQPGMVHHAANRTDHRVVILLATLYPKGAPASSPAG